MGKWSTLKGAIFARHGKDIYCASKVKLGRVEDRVRGKVKQGKTRNKFRENKTSTLPLEGGWPPRRKGFHQGKKERDRGKKKDSRKLGTNLERKRGEHRRKPLGSNSSRAGALMKGEKVPSSSPRLNVLEKYSHTGSQKRTSIQSPSKLSKTPRSGIWEARPPEGIKEIAKKTGRRNFHLPKVP